MNFSRRLLDVRAVAGKIGCSARTFKVKRPQLEGDGFPKPVLPADQYGTNRWDEAAIDAWLDSRMDPALKNYLAIRPSLADPTLPTKLKQRAEALSL